MKRNLVAELNFLGREKTRDLGHLGVARIVCGNRTRHALQERDLVEHAGEPAKRLAEGDAFALHVVGVAHHLRGVARSQRPENSGERIFRRHPEHRAHGLGRDGAARKGDRLVEKRKGIAHRAPGALGNNAKSRAFGGNPFFLKDMFEMLDDPGGRHVAQAELQASRKHRDRNLLRVRRRKNELHILGRLLKGLQHRIEGRVGEHVHFVDHVDLVAAFGRRIHRALKELRHVFDGAVRGRIHLDVVDEAPLINRAACLADAAGVRGDAALAVGAAAVERLGENSRDRRFADAAGAGEEVGVVQTPLSEGARQRRDHVVLADDRLKVMGAPLARKYLVAAHGMRLILSASQAHILANGPGRSASGRSRGFSRYENGEPYPRHCTHTSMAASFPT